MFSHIRLLGYFSRISDILINKLQMFWTVAKTEGEDLGPVKVV